MLVSISEAYHSKLKWRFDRITVDSSVVEGGRVGKVFSVENKAVYLAQDASSVRTFHPRK